MTAPLTLLSTLTDYLGLQDDLTVMVLAHPLLQQVNAVQERKFLLDSSIQIDALWMNPRNGGAGEGIIIEDIRAMNGEPNAAVCDLLCSLVILGERNISKGPAGCQLQPEQIEQIILDLFDGKLIQPYGTLFKLPGTFSEPAHDWINAESGIYARRISFKMKNARKQTDTCDLLQISVVGGIVQMTCNKSAAGVQIWFTTDGSTPVNDGAINSKANLYTGPFPAASGTIVRAMAFAPNLNPSALKQTTV